MAWCSTSILKPPSLTSSHAVASYDVFDGAWTIAQAYRFFPPRTVHVVVVDPGVGGTRRPIIVETDDYIFVAPDNGVLSLVEMRETEVHRASRHRRTLFSPAGEPDLSWPRRLLAGGWMVEQGCRARRVRSRDFRLHAPGAARRGAHRREQLARAWCSRWTSSATSSPTSASRRRRHCSPRHLPRLSILVAGQTITRVCHSYGEGGEGEFFAIVGSSGYLEIAARQASAAEKLASGVGTPVGVVFGD